MEATLRRWNIDGVDFDLETAWGLTVARGRFDRGFKSTGVTDSGQGKLHVEGRLEVTGKVVPVAFDAVVHRVDRGLQMDVTARVDGQQFRKSGAQLRMILPATVHVTTRLSDARTPVRADSS